MANIKLHIFVKKILYFESRTKYIIIQHCKIHEDGIAILILKSCYSFLARLEVIKGDRSLQLDPWTEDEESDVPTNWSLVENVHSKPPASDFPRKLWSRLNRLLAGKGWWNYLLHKIKMKSRQTLNETLVRRANKGTYSKWLRKEP